MTNLLLMVLVVGAVVLAPGVVSRQRRGGGRPIWRCQQHRNLWPQYAVEFALVSPDTKSGE
jgi:hypothetical protein